jgi:hypothetical protein
LPRKKGKKKKEKKKGGEREKNKKREKGEPNGAQGICERRGECQGERQEGV